MFGFDGIVGGVDSILVVGKLLVEVVSDGMLVAVSPKVEVVCMIVVLGDCCPPRHPRKRRVRHKKLKARIIQ